jgi:predicted dehydrogenase
MRIGLIGFGGSGQAHAFYWSCVAGCRVTKIFDPKPPAAAREAERFWPDLDAVVVCTPDATHAGYVVAALERGLHVLVEKPLTDSLEGLCAIRRAAAAAPAQVVAVVHQMRFVPLHRRLKMLVGEGALGTLSYLEGYYVHDLTTRAFQTDRWRETDNATPLVYSGCHFVDLLRWIAGEEIVEVFAAAGHRAFPEYPESDLNLVTLRFASGAIGKVVVAFGEPGPQDHTVRVAGTEASVRGNLLYRRNGGLGEVLHRPMVFQPTLLRGRGKTGGQTRYRQLRTNLPPYLFARSVEALRLLARRPNAEYGAANYPVRLYEHSLACVGAIEDFVASVRDRRPPLCSIDEAGRTVLACLAGVESYRTNRPVAVPELDS